MKVTLLHGFTQTARCWGPIDAALSAAHGPRPLDLPGHGSRTHDAVPSDLWAAGELIADAMPAGALVGYSLGGRVALHTALRRPDAVRALVLISATAGLRTDAERDVRRAADEQLAVDLETAGVEPFVDRWLDLPLFEHLSERYAYRPERLRNSAEGLAASLRHHGTGTQEPLWDRCAQLQMPVLILSGALDEKFTTLGAELSDAIGDNATHVVIPGAGHTTHLEQPGATAVAILRFLGDLA